MHNKPDIIIIDKETGECYIIDETYPFDTRLKEKEQKMVKRYQELKENSGRLQQKKGSDF